MFAVAKPNSPVKKALIVDENLMCIYPLKEILLREGFNILIASDGLSGIQTVLRDSSISLVLSSSNLSGIDGASFLMAASMLLPEATTILLKKDSKLIDAAPKEQDGVDFVLSHDLRSEIFGQSIHGIISRKNKSLLA